MRKSTKTFCVPAGWDVFNKLKEGHEIKMRKIGDRVSVGFLKNRKWIEIFNFTEAPDGEGVMDWKSFKERTKTM